MFQWHNTSSSKSGIQILLAPDKFKGTLTSREAAEAMSHGLSIPLPNSRTIIVPFADGGEGTLNILEEAGICRIIKENVRGPFDNPIETIWGISHDGITAWLELSAVAGPQASTSGRPARASGKQTTGTRELTTVASKLITASKYRTVSDCYRNPMTASTQGLGMLMEKALAYGVRELIIFAGGSITCDGGTGAMAALGARFLDSSGNVLPQGGGALVNLAEIDLSNLNPLLSRASVTIAADVFCPMHGPDGAAMVFAPQKGANPADTTILDAGLRKLTQLLNASGQQNAALHHGLSAQLNAAEQLNGAKSLDAMPMGLSGRGSALPFAEIGGAAGGAAGGLAAMCGGIILSGGEIMARTLGIPELIASSNLVITGEGRTDGQTVMGKGPWIIASIAKKMGIPVLILSGSLGPGWEECQRRGISVMAAANNGVRPGLPLPAECHAMLRQRTIEIGYALVNGGIRP
ncbi:MAG: hypothetical protein CVV64_18145 [Candidatus Wallbacteria bacterium HGW-Wallbacteria-1]|jgi:glycerate kinase|uniref:Glycerate kinase n=1 Tax=Candidatus Wallbacteria bacterium HGW-Wallbacteria-1 TaxID=2013854 RepID=A0A2N1PJQ4_9BACT|nr:MAG: hypothetical protein CVV64_18145 [Candidatus Wallbacteria bacterium HGW-Wallbacteria-1]